MSQCKTLAVNGTELAYIEEGQGPPLVLVHGSLLDLPALFGGPTTSPQSPAGLSGRFFLATLLAGACTVLLLREGGERA